MAYMTWNIVARVQVGSIELLGKLLYLLFDEDAGIGLAIERFDADRDDTPSHEEDPEDPAPASALGYESSCDGSYNMS
jgi:hypothetical protein